MALVKSLISPLNSHKPTSNTPSKSSVLSSVFFYLISFCSSLFLGIKGNILICGFVLFQGQLHNSTSNSSEFDLLHVSTIDDDDEQSSSVEHERTHRINCATCDFLRAFILLSAQIFPS